MTPTVVVGDISDSDNMEVVTDHQQAFTLRYGRPELEPNSTSYPVVLGPRLRATVCQSEQVWIASAPELNALGHGETAEAALDSLCDAVEQYLEYLRDDKPKLAPEIARHADYIKLLDSPRGLWFAAVKIDAAPVE